MAVVARGVATLVGVVKAGADTTAATMATATISPRTIPGTKVSNRDPPLLAVDRVRASLVLRRLRSRVVHAVAMVVVVGTMSASEWAEVVRAEAAVSSLMPFLSFSLSEATPACPFDLSRDSPTGWTEGQGYGSNRGGGGGFGGESKNKSSSFDRGGTDDRPPLSLE